MGNTLKSNIAAVVLLFLSQRRSIGDVVSTEHELGSAANILSAHYNKVVEFVSRALSRGLDCGAVTNCGDMKGLDNSRRWRPHPNDFNFPGIIKYKPRTEGPRHLVFALAMHWGFKRDKTRLQMLMNLRPEIQVFTVAWSDDPVGKLPHLSSDFTTRRGLETVASYIKDRKSDPNQKVSVFLDY